MEPATPLTRADLIARGFTAAAIRRALEQGALVRVRPGSYIAAKGWESAHSEVREIVLARAAQQNAHFSLVFSHVTAAALHGLPLWRHRPDRPHVMGGSQSNRSSCGPVIRHRDRWDGEVVVRNGLRATSLARTVFDVLCTTSRETAIAAADAALRLAGGGGRDLDADAVAAFREEVEQLIDAAFRHPGVAQARELFAIADPSSDSPGESVSRLYLHDLGFAPIATQVRVAAPHGGSFFADFGFAGLLGEYDGAQKYVDPAMLAGRTTAQAVADEKAREDWIRARTGKRMIRWTTADIRSLDHFARFIRSAGVAR